MIFAGYDEMQQYIQNANIDNIMVAMLDTEPNNPLFLVLKRNDAPETVPDQPDISGIVMPMIDDDEMEL